MDDNRKIAELVGDGAWNRRCTQSSEWRKCRRDKKFVSCETYSKGNPCEYYENEPLDFLHSPAAAWMLLESLDGPVHAVIFRLTDAGWTCSITKYGDTFVGHGKTKAEALVNAVLAAGKEKG